MKKIFALALAAIMTAGMTTVAFAAPKHDIAVYTDGGDVQVYYDMDDDGVINGEKEAADTLDLVDGGTELYIPLKLTGGTIFSDDANLNGWKIGADWIVGELEEKPEFVIKKIDGNNIYAIKVVLPENEGTKTISLAGSIYLYSTGAGYAKDDATELNERRVALDLEYGKAAVDFVDQDLAKASVIDFSDYEGETTLTFGDYFEFEVDLTSQKKLNVKNNQDFNKDFAAMYDYANIDFINFVNEPTFNKNGIAYIYADEDAFIYEVTADGAKEIAGLEWDEDYEAWTFKTRTLKSYAISDVELDEKTVTDDKDDSSSTTDGGKDNPDTGR